MTDRPAPYSEIETLRIQNVALERVVVQHAMTDWQAKVKALKADLEAERHGWSWNPDTGEWTALPKESSDASATT